MWREIILRFLRDDSGPTAAEYAVMLTMIAITAILAIQSFGDTSAGYWGRNVSEITTATGNTP
ncbi:hypothetical protein BH23PLA1_BH23PLA1_04670 [soil metagenome]